MSRGIVSCPNCTTMVLITALAPLHRAAGIERMVVSTYQSVSGAGQAGMRELDEQWTKGAGQVERLARAGALEGMLEPGEQWDRPIAGNVIPLAGSLGDDGSTSEERKMVDESRKILHAPELAVSVTCVRVPVYVGHAMSANLRFRDTLDAADAAALLDAAPGVHVAAGGAGHPTPLESAGIDPVLVGRVRDDPTEANALNLWVTGDNLRKGAALNAVQIAELLVAG
jgi:aspartate-semialdehyde dehydrogenase